MSTKASTSFELQRLQLTSIASGKSIDIRYVTLEFNVYEDLFSNVVTGDLTISDSNNLISNLPIYGYEILEVIFKSNMDGAMYRKTFRVTNVTNVTPVKDRNNVYVLQYSSPVDLINESTSVSRSYSRYRISDIVDSIAATYLQIPSWNNLEPTKYLHDFTIPTMDPLTAINFLSNRAISEVRNGALYMFYEDRDGFNFRSLESAVAQPPVRVFLLQPANIRNNPERAPGATDILSIQDYTFETLPDVLSNTSVGMYGARLLAHSLVQKIWRIHDFDYVKTYKTFQHTEPPVRRESVRDTTMARMNPFLASGAGWNDETRLGGPGLTSPESLIRMMPFDEERPIQTLSVSYAIPLPTVTIPTIPEIPKVPSNPFPDSIGTLPRLPKVPKVSRIPSIPTSITIPQPPIPTLKVNEFAAKTTNVPKNIEKGYTFTSKQKVERWLLQRDSQRQAMFENVRFVATVPGTVDITVGDMVEIRLPSVEPVTKENPQKLDKYYSGNYLVANVRHRVAQSDNAFYTILECVKDSVYNAFPL